MFCYMSISFLMLFCLIFSLICFTNENNENKEYLTTIENGIEIKYRIDQKTNQLEIKNITTSKDISDYSLPESPHSHQEYKITQIGSYSFSNFTISKIIFPKTIETLNEYCFAFNKYIQKIDLSNCKISFIPPFAFFQSNINEIQLPNSIKELQHHSFYQSSVSSLDLILTKTTKINAYSFAFSSIETINFPNALEFIGEYCFSETFSLKVINLEKTRVRTLSNHIFYNATSLKSIIMPYYLEEVGTESFYNATLESLIFAKSLNTLSNKCFSNMPNLFSIDLSLTSVQTLPQQIFLNCICLEVVKLPQTLLSIESECFSYSSIKTIQLPKYVESLSNGCFKYATKLEYIDLVNTKIEDLSDMMFYGCSELKYIKYPLSVDRIGKQCFAYSGIKNFTVTNQIIDIMSSAFEYSSIEFADFNEATFDFLRDKMFFHCEKLEVLLLSKTITSIGSYCFAFTAFQTFTSGPLCDIDKGCFESSKIEILDFGKSKLKTFSESLFCNCVNLQEIKFPTELEQIQDNCFFNTSLSTVVFPQNTNSFGEFCFAYCSNLKKVEMSNIKTKYIGKGMFCNSSLVEITLMNSLTSIPDFCFQNTNLEHILIPENVDYIGFYAFYNTKIEEIDISNTKVNEIMDSCFEYSRLQVIVLNNNQIAFGEKVFKDTNLMNIKMKNTKKVGNAFFANCSKLVSCDLSESQITEIPDEMFFNCMSLVQVFLFDEDNKEKGSSQRNMIQTIGKMSFYRTSIVNFVFHSSLTHLSPYSFSECGSLMSIDLSKTDISVIPAFCFYNTYSCNELVLNEKIKSIEDNCFKNSGIKSIKVLKKDDITHSSFSLPSSLEMIGHCAFSCSNIEAIDLSSTKITEIFNYTFFNCTALSKVIFPIETIKTIGDFAFSYTKIENLFIHSNVPIITKLEIIGNECFSFNGKLKEVDLSCFDSLTEIRNGTFYLCLSLKSIKWPPNLVSISSYSFSKTQLLTLTDLPVSISYIGPYSFQNCNSLSVINFTLNNDLKLINEFCFSRCSNLSKVILNNQIEVIKNSAFLGCNINTIHWPFLLMEIESNAFVGIQIHHINLYLTRITKIGSKCFSFANISKGTLPAPLTEMSYDTFEGCNVYVFYPGQSAFYGKFVGISDVYVNHDYKYTLIFGKKPKFSHVHEDGSFQIRMTPQSLMLFNTLCFSIFCLLVATKFFCHRVRKSRRAHKPDEEFLMDNKNHSEDDVPPNMYYEDDNIN